VERAVEAGAGEHAGDDVADDLRHEVADDHDHDRGDELRDEGEDLVHPSLQATADVDVRKDHR
jgi:hypothetical protein